MHRSSVSFQFFSHRVHRVFKSLCVLRGLFLSVRSVGKKITAKKGGAMKEVKLKFLLAMAMFWVGLLFQTPVYAQVILGQSCALSGPTAFLGTEMNRGATAYFKKYANEIQLKLSDDRYEPATCIENTNAFLKENVTALFGYVGTPTSKAAVSLAMEKQKNFFGAMTGAEFLSDVKTNPYSFSVRPSYSAEIEHIIRQLKADLGISKIALFVQRDAFGLAGVEGVLKALKIIEGVQTVPPIPKIPAESASKEKWNEFWESVPNYQRNTIAVARDARKISGNRAVEAVILVGVYRPCAEAVKLWKKENFNAIFVNISFVGSSALAEALDGNVKNVLISQVVPNPWDAGLPLVKEYQDALGNGKYEFISLEGYLAAKIIHKAVKNAGNAVNSESLKKFMEAMRAEDFGGVSVSFGPADHRGLDAVYLTKIEPAEAGGKPSFRFIYVDKITRE